VAGSRFPETFQRAVPLVPPFGEQLGLPIHFHPKRFTRKRVEKRGCVLAGLVLATLTAPAWAGRSTPAERETTRQLNLEVARLAQSRNQPFQKAPEIVVADPSANLPPASPPVAAPTTPVEYHRIGTPDGAAP